MSEHPERGPRYKWYVVAMLWWIAFFNYADRQAIYAVFPLLEQEMGLTPVQLGLLGSSFAWVYGLGAPFAGNLVDRVRRKTAILAGLHAWSIICMLTALSRNFHQLVFFRAAEGLGETFYFPASASLVSDYHGKRTRSRALGIHQTSVYLGIIGGGYLAGLISEHYGWRTTFVLFGGLGILLGLGLHYFLHEPRRGAADAEDGTAEPALRKMPLTEYLGVIAGTPTVLMLLLAFVCTNYVAMVLYSWMPKFLSAQYGLGLANASLTATLYPQLSSLLGALAGGWLADHLRARVPSGRVQVQFLATLLGAPFVFLAGWTDSLTLLIVALCAWGFCKGLYDANIFASVFDVIRPEARGTAAGFMNLVGWLAGGASAPLVVGLLAEQYGLSLAISSAAAVYVAAAGLLFLTAALFFRRDLSRASLPGTDSVQALDETGRIKRA